MVGEGRGWIRSGMDLIDNLHKKKDGAICRVDRLFDDREDKYAEREELEVGERLQNMHPSADV